VTDDQDTIDLITKEAGKKGCEVKVYRDSVTALNVLNGNPGRCDFLIVDEDMDDVSGSFIAERLLGVREMTDVMLLVKRLDRALNARARSIGVRWVTAKPSLLQANVITSKRSFPASSGWSQLVLDSAAYRE
jgi:DNA-binding response OmpR family regulator